MQRSRRGRGCQVVAGGALLVAVMLIYGCVAIPTKMPTHYRGGGGVELTKDEVDLTFIKLGSTRREEVAKKLEAIDCGAPAPVFWGCWAQSSWGVVAGAITGLDPGQAEGGSGRHWHIHHVLVTFDAGGIARDLRTIDDANTLQHELLRVARNSPTAATPKEPIRLTSIDKKYEEVVLSAESLQFRATKASDSVTLVLPGPVNLDLRPQYRSEYADIPDRLCYRLEASDAQRRPRAVRFCTAGRQLLELLAYLDHLPAPARWQGH